MIELIAPTRFSAKPTHPNTFMNFAQSPMSPGFIAEAERVKI